MSRKLLMLFILFVGVCLVTPAVCADPGAASASSPAFTPDRAVPKELFIRITYAPGGENLGTRDRFLPPGSSYEAYEATIRSALIEIAAAAGRPEHVARVQRETIMIVDNATLGGGRVFSTDSAVKIAQPDAVTEGTRHPPHNPGVHCTCSSLVCSSDVCGKFYCSGGCGGCNICG